jgi:hypothetical protein
MLSLVKTNLTTLSDKASQLRADVDDAADKTAALGDIYIPVLIAQLKFDPTSHPQSEVLKTPAEGAEGGTNHRGLAGPAVD